tara:strand:+ start:126 stop:317 length:192 start_codon:yes stop_codon:yes gene_type:complete
MGSVIPTDKNEKNRVEKKSELRIFMRREFYFFLNVWERTKELINSVVMMEKLIFKIYKNIVFI